MEPELGEAGVAGEEREALEGRPGSSLVKQELQELDVECSLGYKECVLCSSRTDCVHDIFNERTTSGVALANYISKLAKLNLDLITYSKYACGACVELTNIIERAEIQFLEGRNRLLDIIARNPLLEGCGTYEELDDRAVALEYVKVETGGCKSERRASTEDDEPLSRRVRKRHLNLSHPNYRSYSSDDDFYWKLDANTDDIASNTVAAGDAVSASNTVTTSNTNKKRRIKVKKHKKRKTKVNIESDENDPSAMLLVELKEQEVGEIKPVEKARKMKTKLKNKKIKDPNERRGRKKKSDELKDKEPAECPECHKIFTKPCYLKYHMAQIHKMLPHEFMCEVCGRGFRTKKQCNDHVLLHQGISQWKCEPCNKLFPSKTAFLRHDKIHNGKPKYQCDLCGKSFIHHSSFRKHNLMHSGIRRAACDICGLAFFFNSHLNRHKRIHEGNEKRFECEVCGKKFSDKYYLQTHLKTHDKTKLPPASAAAVDSPGRRKRWFRCEMCEEKFDRLFKLELHLVHDHKQVLKKGPPKPRNTWKKLQRAQAAAASMVNAIATAMSASAAANAKQSEAARMQSTSEQADVKPSVSSLNEKIKETSTSGGSQALKSSPNHSMSPTAYMSPPQVAAAYQSHIRSSGASWPAALYHVGAGYAARMPDYPHD